MNSRERRKVAAQEHNDRIELKRELRAMQSAIYAKHGVHARAVIDERNFSLVREIERLRGILEADAPLKPVKVASRPIGGGFGLSLFAVAAGMGVVR